MKTFKIWNNQSYSVEDYDCEEISLKKLKEKWNTEDLKYRCTQNEYDIYVSRKYNKYYCVKN